MIRFASPNDKDACIKMMREFYNTGAVLHPVSDSHFAKTFALSVNGSPLTRLAVCIMEDQYAGYINISLTHSNEAGGLVVFLEEIYVRDAFQGNGIGTKLIQFIRQEYDDAVKRYRLEVCGDNLGAIKLYERLGFEGLAYKQMVIDL